MASKLFEKFFQSMEFEDVISHYRDMCEILQIKPGPLNTFYPTLKGSVRSICGVNLFQVLDKKINSDCFGSQYICPNQHVVIVGGGPCGLRTAIEAALLGATVTVCEKRTSFTRNNVLHLWPYVIEDLKLLGVKQFFPKFCTGSMNHISIRRLQSVLLKVALVLGVRVYEGVEFVDLVEPNGVDDEVGWRVKVNPNNHPLNKVNVDMLIGAEGKRVTIPGFKRKEFRGKLAIAITANFRNRRTTAEAVVEEISGVAFVYKQDFFNNLYEELGIALENIVYYKDETHYFVMTTKKHSLLDRGVLLKDCKDPLELLSPKNTNKAALLDYIKDACDYCTDYQLPELDFELNHHGEADVALFDFTSMFAASNSSYVKEKNGKQILLTLVGDGLLEPFWPTGSGAARGFLGCMDACYMLKEWSAGSKSVLEILAERESIFRLLPQTTSENIAKDYKNYTVDPTTRYPNLNKYLYSSHQMEKLYINDDGDTAKGDLPRRDYTESCNQIRSAVPSYGSSRGGGRFGQRPQPQPVPASRQRAGSIDYYDDSGSSSGSPQVEHRDLKSRMRALMEAANGGGSQDKNDADEYMANRSKILSGFGGKKDPAKPSPTAGSKQAPPGQTDRKMAMAKISQTFGYGENPKEKKPGLMSAKERQAEHRKAQAEQARVSKPLKKQHTMPEISLSRDKTNGSRTAVQTPTKTKSTKKSSQPGGVKQWDFTKQQQNGKSKSVDDSIDPELDAMLAELETDEDFKKLSDNDQLTWLESLFYLDTPTKMASSKLVKSRPAGPPAQVEMPRRREKSALSLYSSNKNGSTDTPDSPRAAAGVTRAKTFSIQSSGGGASTTPVRRTPSSASATKTAVQNIQVSNSKPSPQSSVSSSDYVTPVTSPSKSSDVTDAGSLSPESKRDEVGLNKDLCSLAQQFFQNGPKASKPQKRQTSVSSTNGSSLTKSPPPRERAFFQPTGSEDNLVDEEEEEMPSFEMAIRKNNVNSRHTPPQEEGAPPIPVRSGEGKLMMLKLMKGATKALKS